MAFNQFVPFATGAGANALTPDAFASEPARQTGVQAGTARSILANAAWRQGTTVASMVGAFIVDAAGQNANDDGNVPALLASFKAGVSAIALAAVPPTPPASLWHYGVASGSPTAIVVNSPDPAISGYVKGLTCLVEMPTSFGTGNGATFRIGSLPIVNLLRNDGSPIQNGDGPPGGPMLIEFDGLNFRLVGYGRAEVQRITLNPILWVRPDGNDMNDGTSNDSAHAFATLAGALNRGTSQFNFSSSALTIRLGVPASYPSPQYLPTATGRIEIVGDEGNKSGYIISGAGSAGQGSLQTSGILNLRGLTIQNTGSNSHTLVAADKAVVNCFNVDLVGVQTTNGYHAYGAGGSITFSTGCTIRGNASAACWGEGGGQVVVNVNASLAIVGNPNFTVATIVATNQSRFTLLGGASVTGSATGPRYIANNYSIISTNGAGPNAFPGDSAGTLNNSIYS